ncbi:MAG TPA: PQQ-binding-like beta-propeller repeat protein [Kiloniellales bacterium]|nr:PQQ-binding-like beta-propeller repeat protein [Kiloniellales bacterium]
MKPRLRRSLAPFLALGVVLSGCSGMDFFADDEERLPGQRIAILALDRGVQPDPEIADLEVRLAEPYVDKRWTHTGGNAAHAMYHLALGGSPQRVWTADVGAGAADNRRILAQPLLVDGVVYTMDALETVSAFNAGNGRVLWRTEVEPENEDDGYFGGGIAYDSGRIYVTTGFAQVIAVDASNGSVIWRQRVGAPMRAAPTVADGRVYAITLDNQTVALDADDGQRLWSHSGVQEVTGLVGSASPAITGSTVIVAYSSGEIFGLLAENGRVLWSDTLASIRRIDPLSDIAHIRASPVVDRGGVFAISHSGRMVAIDLRRGARGWDVDLGGVEMPWVGGDFVYVVTNDAQVVCLTRDQGRVRWVRSLPRYEDPEDQTGLISWSGPVLAGDRLIVAGSNGQALSISPYDGEVLGTIDLPGPVRLAPVVADNTLLFLTESGRLIAMR